jgi:hypothetical protein
VLYQLSYLGATRRVHRDDTAPFLASFGSHWGGASQVGYLQGMSTTTFEQRVDQITDQIRASDPSIATEIKSSRTPEVAEWARGRFKATLILHRDEAAPRLALQLYNGEAEHPAALQIGFDEADVVNMIAVPIAAHLTGHSEA